MLTVGSLFAGIGGFDLGFERAGMRTLWQVELDPYCRAVLARHFPGAARFADVRTVTGCTRRWEEFGGTLLEHVDVLCGGFPCQDLSYAGRGAGIEGERSGLWSEYARLIRELRPRYVVVENVPALLARGLGRVLGDLAESGYDAEWDCLPASAFGAPHRRDRIWLVAYPVSDDGRPGRARRSAPGGAGQPEPVGPLQVSDPNSVGPQGHGRPLERAGERTTATGDSTHGARAGLADADGTTGDAARPAGEAIHGPEAVERSGRCSGGEGSPWAVEPDVGRVAHGVPARVDRLRSLGNALVPQIAEAIGRRIIEAEGGVAA